MLSLIGVHLIGGLSYLSSKFDEDTQMALALSTSIQQTETESQQQPTQNSSQDFGKELQNAFKLLMTPKNKDLGAPKKRGKSKK